MKNRLFLSLSALLLGVNSVAAQTVAPVTGEIITIYRQGQATAAVAPVLLNRAFRTCNLVASLPVSGTVANPNVAEWDDPDNAGRVCKWTDPGSGVLMMLVADNNVTYEGTLKFDTTAGQTPESPRSNLFTRPGILRAAPAQLRLVRIP